MSIPLLTAAERTALLAELPDWDLTAGAAAIHRSLTFTNFAEAFAFMTRVARLAQEADHHPTWTNTWNHLEITLTTHEAGGLTTRDIELAKEIDALL